jgi:type VI secretion system ImpH/TssG family protein
MEDIRRLIKSLSNSFRQKIFSPDFWGLVRKLENSKPENPRIGYAKHPANENVRFGQTPFLYLPASDIAGIQESKIAGVDAVIFTYFLGLLGINGPMPLEFTSYVYRRSYNHYDHTWRRFLDIIHHRMHVLYYRAFAQNEQSISFDRKADDPIRGIVKSLTGLPPNTDYDSGVESIAVSYASRFSFAAKNRSGLEEILRRMLGCGVKVKDFIVTPYDLDPDDYALLGNRKTSVLGVNLQIGRTYLSATRQFEIHIGPVGLDTYRLWASTYNGFEMLRRVVSLYLDRPLDCSIVFKLVKAGEFAARIGGQDVTPDKRPQLGISCWIGSVSKEMELRIDASRFRRIGRQL